MLRLILLTVLALGAGAAHAENGFFYLGAGLSHNDVSNIGDLDGIWCPCRWYYGSAKVSGCGAEDTPS
jgi:hypothetical protein